METIYCQGAEEGREAKILQPVPPPPLLLYKRNFYIQQPSVQSAHTPISLYTSTWLPLVPGSQQAWACSQLTLEMT